MASTKNVGPEGPIQPSGSREKRLPSDPEAFQKKLEKAGETDPDEKKKRRQQEEEVEKASDNIKEAHKADRTKDTIAPFEIGKKTGTPSLEKGAPKPASPVVASTPPPTDEVDTESLFWEEGEFDLAEQPPIPTDEKLAAAKVTADAKEGIPPEKVIKKVVPKVAPLPLGEAEMKKGEGKERIGPPPPEAPITAPSSPALEIAPPPAPTEATPYAQLSPQALALFEKMAGVMTVMTQSGITETSISLTSDQFSGSHFYGTEIVIREYSTAPKQFNIEVRGNAAAVSQFQANIPYIESAFRTGNYKFGIHRLETSISRIEDEPVSGDQEDKEKEG